MKYANIPMKSITLYVNGIRNIQRVKVTHSELELCDRFKPAFVPPIVEDKLPCGLHTK